MVKSNQFREQNEIKRESTPVGMVCTAEETKLASSSAWQCCFTKTKFSVQIIHMWGESVRKIWTIPSSKFEDNLIRYCYDVFWLKFTYEITVARIKAQDKYKGRIHFSTVHKPPDLSNSPLFPHLQVLFFPLLPSLRPNTSRNTSITIKYLYINSPNALQQHPEAWMRLGSFALGAVQTFKDLFRIEGFRNNTYEIRA